MLWRVVPCGLVPVPHCFTHTFVSSLSRGLSVADPVTRPCHQSWIWLIQQVLSAGEGLKCTQATAQLPKLRGTRGPKAPLQVVHLMLPSAPPWGISSAGWAELPGPVPSSLQQCHARYHVLL